MYELIITEKPKAAQKIADALADDKAVKQSEKKVPFYKLNRNKKEIVVVGAVGHLFGLAEKEKNGWSYPVFDIEWKPNYETSKEADFSKAYYSLIKKLSKDAKEFTVATDYDVEGEVIGLNIIRYICKQKDANRMKFSTLTKGDIEEAYEKKSKTLDWGQANAGETRHELDWYWGINTSRALTSAIKSTGMFKILSSGRVQGPALKIIVDREKEINAFISVPYWQIELKGESKEKSIIAWHKEDKFWEKEKAENVMKNVKGKKKGIVDKVEKNQFKQNPPHPFDLTSLQIEAYRTLNVQPKKTLEIAQELYTSGYISYPRTSSQQLPEAIGYSKIISQLKKNNDYSKLIDNLLKNPLKPNNGKKTDPAHPAIYPTGITPKGIKDKEAKVYDLIARRFLATFGKDAVRETMTIDIDVNKEIFIAKGTRTVEKGWHIYYEPYLKLEEEELVAVNKGEEINVKSIKMHAKETQPPKRYTPASIIKELEKKNLGTKSTRAAIVDTLFQRGYVNGTAIGATELGIKTIETLEKYCPEIIDEELTRHFEVEMEQIREKEKKPDEITNEAKQILVRILGEFKKKEKEIGKGLGEANKEANRIATTVGKCPNCSEGELIIRKGKFGKFVACNKHPDCKTTFSLPANAMFKVSDKICEHCNHPMINIIRRKKRPQEICINKECSSKKIDEKSIEEKKCPSCKEGNLILRKSVYGAFMGCTNYPKCRHTEKLNNQN